MDNITKLVWKLQVKGLNRHGQDKRKARPSASRRQVQLPSAERPQLPAVAPLILTPAYFPEGREDLGQNRSFALISEFSIWGRVTPKVRRDKRR